MGAWTKTATATATAKILGVGMLALLMIPLLQLRGLVRERQQRRVGADARIAQGWGGRQVLGGPVLVPAMRQVAEVKNLPPQSHAGSESMLADALKLDVGMAVPRARRAGPLQGGVPGLIYAMPYGLIAAEQYALLVGALVLLAMVGLMMYLTRRIDWYAHAPASSELPAAIMGQS